jgi:hypothetical protein
MFVFLTNKTLRPIWIIPRPFNLIFEISSIIHYNPFLYSIVFVYLFFIFLFLIIGYYMYVEKNSAFFVCSGEAEHRLVKMNDRSSVGAVKLFLVNLNDNGISERLVSGG